MKLADYTSDDRYFDFDPNSGHFSRVKLSSPRKDCSNFSGMAQLLRSPREGSVLVASYVANEEAWISIGVEKWKLFDESLVIKHRETWGGFICELSIFKEDRCTKKFTYFRIDWFLLVDPTYDQLDFSLAHLPVDFVRSELTSLQKQREDFIQMWMGKTPN
ncbi:hypothetical protein [Janthinobacterium sp. 17J80-10]|uniref:hypothetical protein n=1 Tax=Janthinobacterium sp. 17J80-10 TaxID=2497863 RepID=UPI0013E89DEE|nr:hypothetical protein [Janthinobacterium sp. 17J80-10]